MIESCSPLLLYFSLFFCTGSVFGPVRCTLFSCLFLFWFSLCSPFTYFILVFFFCHVVLRAVPALFCCLFLFWFSCAVLFLAYFTFFFFSFHVVLRAVPAQEHFFCPVPYRTQQKLLQWPFRAHASIPIRLDLPKCAHIQHIVS